MFATLLLLILPSIYAAHAAPALISVGDILGDFDAASSTETPTALSQDTVNAEFLRPAQFSRVVYCSTSSVTSWQCGTPCSDLGAGIEVLQAGGDNGLVPQCECLVLVRYFVAHDPSTQSIVVAHQGTDPKEFLSVLNDAEFPLVSLNASRFPGVNGNIQVHDGFQKTFERTADEIHAGVQAGLTSKNVSKVLVTGHSQGAAIAVMDAAMLRQDLDPSVEIRTTVFGLPRGGNAAWADFLDTTVRAPHSLVLSSMSNDDLRFVVAWKHAGAYDKSGGSGPIGSTSLPRIPTP
ncbi:hypothetical protein C0993_000654 [Termitomyces sp. T159_Od127]|nr:hypothetical protein C0993_000654 [Termitomyces sp. T159_Od127]